jgi:hypothetical protein
MKSIDKRIQRIALNNHSWEFALSQLYHRKISWATQQRYLVGHISVPIMEA